MLIIFIENHKNNKKMVHKFSKEDREKAKSKRKATNQALKKRMLEALEVSCGVVSAAAKVANVSRFNHYKWIKDDEEYREKAQEIQEIALDVAEESLIKRLKEGDTTAIMYYLNNKGGSRGYGKKLLEFGGGSTQKIAEIPRIVWVKTGE
jgi:hypothetical protein